MIKAVHELPNVSVPAGSKSKYPCEMLARIDWPLAVDYDGKRYHWYNKPGNNLKSGKPAACYRLAEEGSDERIWLLCDGTIQED